MRHAMTPLLGMLRHRLTTFAADVRRPVLTTSMMCCTGLQSCQVRRNHRIPHRERRRRLSPIATKEFQK
jgi:hypothetical protein